MASTPGVWSMLLVDLYVLTGIVGYEQSRPQLEMFGGESTFTKAAWRGASEHPLRYMGSSLLLPDMILSLYPLVLSLLSHLYG
jgi:hypothetical protein